MSLRWLPNAISILRIALISPILIMIINGNFVWAIGLFLLAGFSDGIDGYLAKRFNWRTRLGALLDPVADKLLVITSLLLVLYDKNNIIIFTPICIIVLREVLISALREWAARENFKKPLDVNNFGKLKTLFQMFSIGFLLFNGTVFTISTYMIGLYGIYIAAFLSLVSMIIYLGNVIKS